MNHAYAMNVADLIEKNGRTVLENNMEKPHNISIGTLVEVQYDEWMGDGACTKAHARLWVISHDRDCDGTPLYTLSPYKKTPFDGAKIILPPGYWSEKHNYETLLKSDITNNILSRAKSGFTEEDLTPIEVTQEIKDGVGSLHWEEK